MPDAGLSNLDQKNAAATTPTTLQRLPRRWQTVLMAVWMAVVQEELELRGELEPVAIWILCLLRLAVVFQID